MTNEQIDLLVQHQSDPVFKISFRKRNTVKGLFIMASDYAELKSKNFWRVVVDSKLQEYKKTLNADLTCIFYGNSFTRLNNIK